MAQCQCMPSVSDLITPCYDDKAFVDPHLMAAMRASRCGQSLSVTKISALVQLCPALCTRPATISSA